MVLFCFYNIIQRELTHVEISQGTKRDLSHTGYTPTWVKSRRSILESFFKMKQFLLVEEQFSTINKLILLGHSIKLWILFFTQSVLLILKINDQNTPTHVN